MKKAALALGGLLAALLLLELALRVPAWLPAASAPEGSFNILALGESTTQGGYLPADQYPAQLETVLLGSCPRLKFHISNGGMAGARAADILAALPELLKRSRPRIALTMIGINDLLGAANPGQPVHESPWRLLRLLTWLRESLRADHEREGFDYFTHVSQPLLNAGDPSRAEAKHRETIARAFQHRQAHLDLGHALLLQKRYEEALEVFRKVPRPEQDAEPALGELVALHGAGEKVELAHKAKAFFRRALSTTEALRADDLLRRAGLERALQVTEGGRFAELQALRARGPGTDWPAELVQTYRAIITRLEAAGVKVYSFNYPRQSAEPVRRFAPNVIDTGEFFERAVKQEGYAQIFYDSFGGNFGHLTQRGNWLLASRVGEELLRDPALRKECGLVP